MVHRTNAPLPRRLCVVVALLSVLALAGPAAAQNLGGPDAPPGSAPAPASTEVAPTPAPSATPTPAPTLSATPDQPSDPAAPADAQAAAAATRARAAAAAERARALRAAAQRKRIRENIAAIRTAALRGGQALTGTREATRASSATAAVVPPAVTDAGGSGGTGKQRILLILLAAAAVGFGLAAYPSLGRRGGALQRVRLELAGVSVACVLVLLLVAAGVV